MTKEKLEIVTATKNAGKIKELKELLVKLPFRLRSLNDFPKIIEPEETGATFVENAVLKAEYYSLQTKLWALADDSGLEVEALSGAPGVFSARYAGDDATDSERIKKLLEEINETKKENRRARFVCAMAIADERGKVKHIAEGICKGRIAFAPRGSNGFGYDPVFIPDGFSQTFGELSTDIKQQLSHRAQASLEIIQYLRGIYAAAV
jgi:XTP/dITP diphosphohydrolase